MTIETIAPAVMFLVAVATMGWKLNGELSSIKTMLQVFIAESKGHFATIEKLEKRIDKLEEKVADLQKP